MPQSGAPPTRSITQEEREAQLQRRKFQEVQVESTEKALSRATKIYKESNKFANKDIIKASCMKHELSKMSPHGFMVGLVLNSCNKSDSRVKLLELEHPMTWVAIQKKALIFEAQNFPPRDLSGREQTNTVNVVTTRQTKSGSEKSVSRPSSQSRSSSPAARGKPSSQGREVPARRRDRGRAAPGTQGQGSSSRSSATSGSCHRCLKQGHGSRERGKNSGRTGQARSVQPAGTTRPPQRISPGVSPGETRRPWRTWKTWRTWRPHITSTPSSTSPYTPSSNLPSTPTSHDPLPSTPKSSPAPGDTTTGEPRNRSTIRSGNRPGTSPEQGKDAKDVQHHQEHQEDQENQEYQEMEEQRYQENQGNGHEDNELQGDMAALVFLKSLFLFFHGVNYTKMAA